jgi:N utilization substance protein B
MPGSRREAREEALAFLYGQEISGATVAEGLADRLVPLESYAEEMVTGVEADRDRIDTLIGDHLRGWRLARMALVDRTIARMATWELLHRPDVPTGVVLSEAVELATLYSGEDSPRFLNGVLGAVASAVRDDAPAR